MSVLAITFFFSTSVRTTVIGYVNCLYSFCAYPVIRLVHVLAWPFVEMSSWWKTTSELRDQLHDIRYQLETARAENIALRAQDIYYKNIQELVDFRKRYDTENGVIATVISKDISGCAHTFLVDAGSRKEIHIDMIAVWKNVLVGRVTKVYPWYSQITLITDRRCRVPACCSDTGTKGIHEGMNNRTVTKLNYVSHLEKINVGETILSSGEGLIFPAGFGIGKVKHIAKDQFGLNLIIDVEPFIDFQSLEVVSLIQK